MALKLVQCVECPKDRSSQARETIFRTSLKVLLGAISSVSLWGLGEDAIAQGYCRAELADRIDAIANRPSLTRAHIGLLVETQTPNAAAVRQTILERNADKWFVPASTLKLLTTTAALQRLGPGFQVQTSAYLHQSAASTSLYVIGRGDPTFTSEQLNDLAQQIVQQDIPYVDQLWGYDGFFSGRTVHPNWEWEDVLAGYGASANGLILDENALGVTLYPTEIGQPLRIEWADPTQTSRWQINNTSLTVAAGSPLTADVGRDWSQPILHVFGNLSIDAGSDPFAIAVTQPGIYFIEQLEHKLLQAGITIGRTELTTAWPRLDLQEIATVTSPPFSQWLPIINQNSNNLYAEALLKILGQSMEGGEDSTQAGTEAVKEILSDFGIESDSYQMVDGSGLSRHNLVTPRTLVDTLQAMARSPHGELYRRSLAIAGQAGNLRHRFRDTPVQGQLQGKTGYVSNNESLAGYLQPVNHPPVVFSIFLNNADLSATDMRQLIDEIILEIAQLSDRCDLKD